MKESHNYQFIITLILAFLLNITIALTQTNIDSLENILKTDLLNSNTLEVRLDLSSYYLRRDLNKAFKYASIAEKDARQLDSQRGIALALTYQAISSMDMGKTEQAEILIIKAIDIFENTTSENTDNNLAVSYSIKGHLENNKNHLDKAFALYLKAAKLCENSEDINAKNSVAIHYNNIALLYRREKNPKKGLFYIKKAIKATEFSNNKLMRGVLFSTAGRFYIELEQLDSALINLNQSLKLKREVDDKLGIIPLLSSIGKVHINKKEYEQAKIKLKEVLKLSNELNYMEGRLLGSFNFAILHYDQKQYNKAIFYAQEVIDKQYNEGFTIERYLEKTYEVLSKSHAALFQFEQAYDYQSKYNAIRDTINQEKQRENIEKLEVTYQLEKKEQEKAAQNKILNQQKKLIWVGGVSLIIISLIALFLYRLLQQRKSLTQSLRQKNKELEQLDKAKTRFFANVSHELKTPLTLIMSPLKQLLKTKKLDTAETFLIQSAEKNSNQLFELTNQILELTKFDVQKVQAEQTVFDFAELIRMTSASFESLAANQNINFSYDYQGNTPLYILSDDYKVKTIIKNLVSNALKYTNDNGEVVIKAIETETKIIITVQDNGQGIRDYDLPYVFDRFYQSRNQDEVVKGGTGIGLAICKEYAQLLGGTIELTSKWAKGSSFKVVLPKLLREPTTQISPLNNNISIKKSKSINIEYQKNLPTILIVEDNLDMQAYLDFTLNPHYNVIKTPHGKAALQTLEQSKQSIDLVISDLMMPVMNGYELMENIKKNSKYSHLPTIMLTALSEMDNKLKALRIGINDYMTKPFEAEELLLRIDYLLEFQQERIAFSTNSVIDKPVTKEKEETVMIPTISQEDEVWLEELEELCLKRMTNVNITVKQLAEEMAMSYSKFWRKTQALLGMTPSQYLQEIRFREARKHIERQKYTTIKQVAYAVGFKDERNFSRNFKKRFGKNPSEYLE